MGPGLPGVEANQRNRPGSKLRPNLFQQDRAATEVEADEKEPGKCFVLAHLGLSAGRVALGVL